MIVMVKLMGIVIVVLGVNFLLKPAAMKAYIEYWKKGKRIRGGAVASLIIGIIFLLAASQCRITWFVALFGILGIVKGVLLFVLEKEKIMALFKWWEKKSDTFLRIYAVIVVAIGILLISAA